MVSENLHGGGKGELEVIVLQGMANRRYGGANQLLNDLRSRHESYLEQNKIKSTFMTVSKFMSQKNMEES